MVELPVGTVFRYKRDLIEVIEENEEIYSCPSCYFFCSKAPKNFDKAIVCNVFNCNSKTRKDKKNVFFIGVAEPGALIV